ncbi:MAG TPA: M14 family zinc carboxypeptidase [Chloroflexia bacterium]|nr:M14 family zinc carboxypeptidase [Chloroflexia bacterium]
MVRKRTVSPGFRRLIIPLCMALIPMLLLSGNPAQSALAGLPTAGVNQQESRPELLVLHVYFRDTAERDRLATELNAEEVATVGGYLTVLADRALYNNIVARGLRVEIDWEGTFQLNNPNLFGHDNNPDTFYGGYRTVEEMQAFLNQQVTNYPNLAEIVDVGDSWCKQHAPCTLTSPSLTWNGYDIVALHITNRSIPGPKPVYWFETAIHSREIATSEVAMRYMSYLLDGYANDPEAHWLVDYHDIWVVPMANPDGHHMVEFGGNNPNSIGQRKNANYTNGCTAWASSFTQLGTDNNRNFPFLWGCCGGSSTASCDQTYRGPSSGSDPETQAIVNTLRTLFPDQRGPAITDAAPLTTTGVYQSMHSSASLNLFPWGFQTTPHAPNDADLRNIGRHLQASNAYPSGNGYPSGQPPELLYAVDGDTADWGYGELGIASYTTEIGGGSFYPTYSTIDSSIWPLNRGALIYQAKIARTPYLLARGPDTNSAVTNPMTVTQGTNSQLTATINYNWTGNSYSQNVFAAEYYIDTPPWAGGTAIPMTPTDGNFNSPTEGAQATIDTSSIPAGRHLIFVRGRGVNDYGGFGSWGPISAAWLTVTGGGSVTPTSTPLAPTATRTSTATTVPSSTTPPTATLPPGTATSISTNTAQVATATRTATALPSATRTNTVLVVPTATRTNTAVAATATSVSTATAQATATCSPGGGPYDIAIVFSDDAAPGKLINYIQADPDVVSLATADARFSTPSLSQLLPYDLVVVFSNTEYDDPVALGNVIADYQDAGGIVVATNANWWGPPYGLEGRWMTGGYTPYTYPAPTNNSTSTLGTYDPSHLLMQDVITLTAFFRNQVTLTAGATQVAAWADSLPLVAYKTTNGHTAVGINAYMGFPEEGWDGDFGTLIVNVARWLKPGAPCGPSTPTAQATAQATSTQTSTSVATPVPTTCGVTFTDVPPDSNFYTWIRCLACRNIISGYSDGTLRPGNDITRGQIAKMVSNAAGFSEDPGPQIYEDVPPASPFYAWINRLSMRGHMGGYPCGLVPEETCIPPDNRPYFRPNASATRGQLAKIVSNAAGLGGDPTDIFYADVLGDNTFYVWIMRLTTLGVMSGYPCGTIPEEPCDEESRPYFRPFSNVTRGQASKIVANTFFPDCQTPENR